jgi:hypothetical protein
MQRRPDCGECPQFAKLRQENELLQAKLLRRGRISVGAVAVTGFVGTMAGAGLVIGWLFDLYGKRH